MDAAASPLPREDTTPPVTNMYFMVKFGRFLPPYQFPRRLSSFSSRQPAEFDRPLPPDTPFYAFICNILQNFLARYLPDR